MIHFVEIEDMEYIPAEIIISKGDSIVWKNNDTVTHTATRDENPIFNTKGIKGATESIPINFIEVTPSEGITYYCKPHPHMEGIIIVK